MKTKTKILIAEHDLRDVELLHDELIRGGIIYISEVVENENDYINALKTFIPDIILCDYTFPSLTAAELLHSVKRWLLIRLLFL